jgi:hypothetical protein
MSGPAASVAHPCFKKWGGRFLPLKKLATFFIKTEYPKGNDYFKAEIQKLLEI